MNRVTLVGNLTKDAEIKEITRKSDNTTTKVAQFRIAVDRPGKNAGADYFACEVWGGLVDAIGQYLVRGKMISFDGRAKSDSWEKEGQRYNRIVFTADNIRLIGGRPAIEGEPVSEDESQSTHNNENNEFAAVAAGSTQQVPSVDDVGF